MAGTYVKLADKLVTGSEKTGYLIYKVTNLVLPNYVDFYWIYRFMIMKPSI